MWLVNTTTLQLEAIVNPEAYRYVILSHTWEKGEVTFGEMADLEQASKKPGFSKIEQICQLARNLGIAYAWVDTCCIDKKSSAELTEAINSMFQWYKNSEVCFVYLSDLPPRDKCIMDDYFPGCRWFTRGWTLQELISPKNIEFYDSEWQPRGTKASLQQQLFEITDIDMEVLENSNLVSTIPVARRMSWAAARQTSRVEDLSYCLFGIFDVNLPLIYGEGPKAFIRLQEAIALNNNDLSLFAWTSQYDHQELRGIFAESPSEFRRCRGLQRITDPTIPAAEFAITNRGVHFTTRLHKGTKHDYLLTLQCIDNSTPQAKQTDGVIAILLLKTAYGYIRNRAHQRILTPHSHNVPSHEFVVHVPKIISPTESHLLKSRLAYRIAVNVRNTSGFTCGIKGRPEHLWDSYSSSFITDGHEKFTGILVFTISGHLPDKKLTRFERECKAILGIVASNATEGETVENRKPIKPLATIILDRENLTIRDIDGLLDREADYGLPDILAQIGDLIRSSASSYQNLPVASELGPTWYDRHKRRHVNISERILISLDLSADLEPSGGPFMNEWVLDLKMERKGEKK